MLHLSDILSQIDSSQIPTSKLPRSIVVRLDTEEHEYLRSLHSDLCSLSDTRIPVSSLYRALLLLALKSIVKSGVKGDTPHPEVPPASLSEDLIRKNINDLQRVSDVVNLEASLLTDTSKEFLKGSILWK